MSVFQHASARLPGADAAAAPASFARQLAVLLKALLHPGEVIAQVQQWRELSLQADRLEASQPEAAAALRRRAARIGRG